MNYTRAAAFGIMLYVSLFILFGLAMYLPGIEQGSLQWYVGFWIIQIPLVLFFAKWYFRKDPPNLKKGILLGIAAVVVGAVLDLVMFGIAFAAGSEAVMDSLYAYYTDWRFYASIAEVLLLCAYAGYEFDATYTKPNDI